MDFFTADLCDEYPDRVYVLDGAFKNYGAKEKICGTVVTVKLDKNNSELIKILRDEEGKGKIVVVDVEDEYFAVVGENLMKFAHKNGYEGIIVNGYIRDTFQIKDIPVALFARGTCPRKYIPVTKAERGIELSFGGVKFCQGDYIYADSDGVILTKEKIV
ncbi:S-adenosylmethionine--2-demethylmenaquinone methyltransferase [Halarcobacter ebronensis]|uniref:4-hydroxy-4-methyl-2-oxoglutarate aldolase n=1 Tax=Halarcobacter ebronensis TaxID=1462615 RepID=A0A4Q0YJN2_9BACT|nr:ribonuclease E activity regulator RraA [Halarcobacter ebronensis]QKF82216.1 ribonuclease activity regulator, RraA family [Halarcobacter ebronensis]RXJ70074.1 S-adenosylmethionine--2-demethylmenaquinone methyltransferase [Halarcobacter ebronensis]RXK03408.1 S-adenosylmethionine--2-demethylmenaquinone methyltransferase [Halarcobacter ebronensis]